MILIPAKIQCDRCDKIADITFEFSVGAQKIPVMTIPYLPEGWKESNETGYGFFSETVHLCPEHAK